VQGDVSLYRLLSKSYGKKERKRNREKGGRRRREEHARTWSSRKVCVDIRMAHLDVTYVLYMRM